MKKQNINTTKILKLKNAFTLAEVLITLVIIGVIASLTVPSLIDKTNKDETMAKIRKVQTTIQSAVNYAIMEQGPVKNWELKDDDNESTKRIAQYLKPHISFLKDCGINAKGCWSSEKTKTLNGKQNFIYSYNGFIGYNSHSAILNDGTNISFDIWAKGGAGPMGGVNSTNDIIIVYVDINGNKKPNTMGKDVFAFLVKETGAVVPSGIDNNSPLCNFETTSNYGGIDCAGKILREGKITYY